MNILPELELCTGKQNLTLPSRACRAEPAKQTDNGSTELLVPNFHGSPARG